MPQPAPEPVTPSPTRHGALDALGLYMARTLLALVGLLALMEGGLALFGPTAPGEQRRPEGERSPPAASGEPVPYVVQTRDLGSRELAGVVIPNDILGFRNVPDAVYAGRVLSEASIPPEALGGFPAEALALRSDAWGFMAFDDDVRPLTERRANERLVICFGGSTMAGWGAPPSESIPANLQRLLSTPEAPVRVVNAGVIAYNSMQEFLYFALELVHAAPDAVVFLDGFNDEYGRENPRRYLPSLRAGAPPPSSKRALLDALALVAPRTVRFLTAQPGGERNAEFFQRQRALYHPTMEGTLRAIAGVALANDIRVVLALQPDIYSKAPASRSAHERELLEIFAAHGMLRPDRAEAQAGARLIYERLTASFAGSEGVAVLDLLVAFDDLPATTYFDDGHYTPIGNARLAERIAEPVARWLAPAPEPPPDQAADPLAPE